MDSSMILFYIIMAASLFGAYFIGMKWGQYQGVEDGYEEGYYAALADIKEQLKLQGVDMKYDDMIDPRD